MLKNIKSACIHKILFSYIDEGPKLKLIKRNKSLQNILNKSIINYKYFSRKYIIYESNGFGKEYTSIHDKLLYEGEYLNGEKNGKGKEYEYDCLVYEGEYLNGKRNGKGKEYNLDGSLSYEGEYLNGKRNGKGKEYWYKNKLKFEGEYLNDFKLIGILYDYEGNILYKLNYKINEKGEGKEFNFLGKLIFEGEYLNGKKEGKGKEYFLN